MYICGINNLYKLYDTREYEFSYDSPGGIS